MSSTTKPSWLLNISTLKDITEHHLFMPASMPTITSLPDELPFKAGLKQFLFWKGQLLPSAQENTIFLAFLGPDGLRPFNVLEVTSALNNICNLAQVNEFYQGANSCFLAISFASKEPITQILNQFKYLNDTIVLTITHQPPNQHRFRLLWLPPMFNINRVHHLLNGLSHSHRIKRESILLAGSFYKPTNVITGTLTLAPGADVNKLPHLIKLPAPHKGCALLSIETRPPFCLKCKEVGHKRPQCSMVKCTLCSKVHFPTSACGSSSYSAVASRNVTAYSDDDWMAEITDNSTSFDTTTSTSLTLDPPSPVSSEHSSNNSTITPVHLHNDQQHSTSGTPTTITPKDDIISTPSSSKIDSTNHSNKLDGQSDSPIPACTTPISTTSDAIILQPASPKPHLNQHSVSSKVIVTELPAPSSTARSHFITYSTAPSTSTMLHHTKLSVHDSDPTGYLFGDPDPDITFSSNSDSDSDASAKMDTSDIITHKHSSRKRKVSHQSHYLPPPSSPTTSTTNENILHQSTTSHRPDDTPASDSPAPLFIQASHIFGADHSQTSALERACPNATFTTDIIKSLRLLFTQGFSLDIITACPQILTIRSTELRKKIKFLITHQGTFTLADILNKNRIEANAYFIPPPTGLQHP